MRGRKIVLVILLLLLLFIIVSTISMYYFGRKTNENKEKQLEIANSIINTAKQDDIEIITKNELEINDNIIGILEIPKLNLTAPIQEGTSENVLKEAIGHFSESSYWSGNVALASHNRSQYVHYFERINELQTGDEIIYKTKFGIRTYIVCENKIISSTDWSVIENTNDNRLTLITCINNKPDNRLCILAKEI